MYKIVFGFDLEAQYNLEGRNLPVRLDDEGRLIKIEVLLNLIPAL